MRRDMDTPGCLLVIATLVAAAAFVVVPSTHREDVTCTVQAKDRAAAAKGGSSMRVYTDCGVLAVHDQWLAGQFDAADQYAALVEGRRYAMTTTGWRIPILSMFPNIIEAKEINQ